MNFANSPKGTCKTTVLVGCTCSENTSGLGISSTLTIRCFFVLVCTLEFSSVEMSERSERGAIAMLSGHFRV